MDAPLDTKAWVPLTDAQFEAEVCKPDSVRDGLVRGWDGGDHLMQWEGWLPPIPEGDPQVYDAAVVMGLMLRERLVHSHLASFVLGGPD